MTTLYFVRHGETVWNQEKKYQGSTDISLSEVGKKQAKQLAQRFRQVHLDAVYASPLMRAWETAAEVAGPKELSINPIEQLKEICFGDWEGLTVEEIKRLYGPQYADFLKDPYQNPFPGEGTYRLVLQRAKIGLERLWKETEGKQALVVSHGGMIRLLLIELFQLPECMFQKLWIDNTGVSIVEKNDDGSLLLRTVNDFSHLQ